MPVLPDDDVSTLAIALAQTYARHTTCEHASNVKAPSVVAVLALAGCSFVIRPTRSRTPAIADAVIAVAATSAAIAFGVHANRDDAPDDGLLGGFADVQETIDAAGAVTFAIYAAVFGASAVYGFATVR